MTKQELRRWVREELKRHDAEELQQLSAEICERILDHPQVQRADTILAFWPLPDEPDIRSAIRDLHNQGKTILLPHVISDTEMEICRYEGDKSLVEGAFGILEPQIHMENGMTTGKPALLGDERKTENGSLVALIPGRAFDKAGHRLGRGRGYYDRYLNSLPSGGVGGGLIGIAYPFQIIDNVPFDENDIPINETIWTISK